MISYNQCINYGMMVKEAIDLMNLHGRTYNPVTVTFGNSEVTFTDKPIIIFHDNLRVAYIDTLINLRVRMSVPNHSSYICFYTQVSDNNAGEIRKCADSLVTDTYEEIELVPKVSEEDWESEQFQLLTMYDDVIVSGIMLEPFCTELLSANFPTTHYRCKQYVHSGTWVNFPFETIAHDISAISINYIPNYTKNS